MDKLKGTKTEANLLTAFAGESMARNRYTYYASQAKKEGYEQISEIFTLTADNEREHAKIWYKLINDGVGKTAENLLDAAEGEHAEWTQMYRDFAAVARTEGFEQIARLFDGVAAIEHEHEERYRALLHNLKNGEVFKKPTSVAWICRNCGHIHVGESAPAVCPVCAHPQAYFEERCENY